MRADGSRQPLAELPPVYQGADHGQLAKAAAVGQRPAVLSAPGGWAIAVDIPKDAVRFEATLGTAKGAAGTSAVRFRLTDCPAHLGWWPDLAWPAIEQRFPNLCRQLVEHLQRPRHPCLIQGSLVAPTALGREHLLRLV